MCWPCVADGSPRKKEQADRAAWEQRRRTSLQTCHRYSLYERPRAPRRRTAAPTSPNSPPASTTTPTSPTRRRCARKLAEYTYRHARASRSSEITVTWLMRALGKCRRTVQRYLRLLEREGLHPRRRDPEPDDAHVAGLLVIFCGRFFRSATRTNAADPSKSGCDSQSHSKRIKSDIKDKEAPPSPASSGLSGAWTAFSAP